MSRNTSEGRSGSDALRQWQTLQLSKIELELQQNALTALQRSADEANASSSLYVQLFEQSPSCCYALDMAGRIVRANQAGAALLAQPASGLQGQPFERYLAPDEQPRWRSFAAILQAGNGRAGMDSQLFDAIPGAAAVRLEARLDTASGLCCLVVSHPVEAKARRESDRDASRAEQFAAEVADEVERRLAAQVALRTAALQQANALLCQQLAEREAEGQALRASAEQLRLLVDSQASAAEQTRQELAHTLHDGVGQNLLALRLDVAMLNGRALHSHVRLHQRAGAALDNLDAMLRTVRAVMEQLRPPALDLGLEGALDWQLAEFRQQSGIACTLDLPDDGVFQRLGSGASLMLFRQLQAALATVQRDGGASALVVSLRLQRNSVLLTITDDGAGGGNGSAGVWRRQRQALAMLGIAERLRAFGGTFDVEYGSAGQGCRISMRLPAERN